MRLVSTLILLGSFVVTGLYVLGGIEFAVGVPGTTVLAHWWAVGDGKLAVLFFGSGFVVFAVLLSTWAIVWAQIMWGTPALYVWLGPALTSDQGFYYADGDPTKTRLTIAARSGRFAYRPSSAIDNLFTRHMMFRYGAQPQDAERALAHDTRAQLALVAFQYGALIFGLIALWHIVSGPSAFGGSMLWRTFLPLSAALALLPLVVVHTVGLISGHRVHKRKLARFGQGEYTKAGDTGLEPGDSVAVTLVQKGRQRRASANKPFGAFYRVEWRGPDGVPLSAVFAFRATRALRADIAELDQKTERNQQITCVVTDNFTLRPVTMASKRVDWV